MNAKRMREKVANNICDREISWEMAHEALVAMNFFGNWEEEDFYTRPVDEAEIKECVWEYCFANN